MNCIIRWNTQGYWDVMLSGFIVSSLESYIEAVEQARLIRLNIGA